MVVEAAVWHWRPLSSTRNNVPAVEAVIWHRELLSGARHCVLAVTALLGLLLAVSSLAFLSMSDHSNWSGAPACFCDGWRSKVLFEDAVSVHTLRGITEL